MGGEKHEMASQKKTHAIEYNYIELSLDTVYHGKLK